jgi:hypothetical protein
VHAAGRRLDDHGLVRVDTAGSDVGGRARVPSTALGSLAQPRRSATDIRRDGR